MQSEDGSPKKTKDLAEKTKETVREDCGKYRIRCKIGNY